MSAEEGATILGALAGAATRLLILFVPVVIICLIRDEAVLAKRPLSVGAVATFIGLVAGGKYVKRSWKAQQGIPDVKPQVSGATEVERPRR